MNILHIIYSGAMGGLERHVVELSLKLIEHGNEVTICILNGGEFVEQILTGHNIKVEKIGMRGGFDLSGVKRFKEILKQGKYDVMHMHCRTFLPNYILWRYRDARKVFTEHGGDFFGNDKWKRILFYHLFACQYDKILVNSNYTKNNILRYVKNFGSKVAVVYCGINLANFDSMKIYKNDVKNMLGVPQDRKIVGIVARLVPRKGIDLFIRAARDISEVRKDLTFLILGAGPEKNSYEKLAKKETPNVDIRFLGMREDTGKILPIFDVFLFTSKYEPFGIVLIEAMASGVPIVGFDIPGPTEIVEHGVTALLAHPFDTKELAANVMTVLNDGNLHSRLSKNGIKKARELFSADRNALSILQIYKDIKKK